MRVIILVLLRFLPLIAATAVALYGVYRGIKALRLHFGLAEDKRPLIDGPSPLVKAEEIANRIRNAIRHDRDEGGGELAHEFEEETHELLERRLPHIMEQSERLSEHLRRRDIVVIEGERREIERKLRSCKDEELLSVLQKNLKLALEREENVRHLFTVRERIQAQIRQIVMGLQNLEDKVLSLRMVEGKNANVAGALDDLRGEVALLEEQYRDLDLHYDD